MFGKYHARIIAVVVCFIPGLLLRAYLRQSVRNQVNQESQTIFLCPKPPIAQPKVPTPFSNYGSGRLEPFQEEVNLPKDRPHPL